MQHVEESPCIVLSCSVYLSAALHSIKTSYQAYLAKKCLDAAYAGYFRDTSEQQGLVTNKCFYLRYLMATICVIFDDTMSNLSCPSWVRASRSWPCEISAQLLFNRGSQTSIRCCFDSPSQLHQSILIYEYRSKCQSVTCSTENYHQTAVLPALFHSASSA